MPGEVLLYGATGYMGKLTAKAAVERGWKPVLAGRNPQKLKAVAASLSLPWRSFSLEDPGEVDRGLSGIAAVLHLAGPFADTSRSMLDACLRLGVHYLDITGEIDVLEACAARSAEATRAGITVMPGVGFDVVPSDCLAAHMKARMPECRHLTLAIAVLGGISRGTALSGIQGLGQGVRVRRDGDIVTLARPLRRDVDFGSGPEAAVAVGWGDVATAFHSTGIPDITVFFRAAGGMGMMTRMEALLRHPTVRRPVQSLLGALVRLRQEGPTAAQLASGRAVVIAEAVDGAGNTMRSRLETPEAYALTVLTSLAATQRVVAGGIRPGFQTPSLAFGPDFILEMPGMRRTDEEA